MTGITPEMIRGALVRLGDCDEYLKEGETPAQCIQRNRDDVSLALGELARCKGELQEARKTVIWLGVGLVLAAALFVVERWP